MLGSKNSFGHFSRLTGKGNRASVELNGMPATSQGSGGPGGCQCVKTSPNLVCQMNYPFPGRGWSVEYTCAMHNCICSGQLYCKQRWRGINLQSPNPSRNPYPKKDWGLICHQKYVEGLRSCQVFSLLEGGECQIWNLSPWTLPVVFTYYPLEGKPLDQNLWFSALGLFHEGIKFLHVIFFFFWSQKVDLVGSTQASLFVK